MSTLEQGGDPADPLSVLWRPIRVNNLTLRNRVIMPAHSTHYQTKEYANYLAARARGGAGLVITGAVTVHPGSFAGPGVWANGYREDSSEAYATLAEAVHAHGVPLFGQLWHSGHHHTGTTTVDEWHPAVAPSSVPSPLYGIIPKALELEDIAELIGAYVATAKRMRDGGMDGVEVHASHGYLLHQFLSPLTNRRTDDYGGGPGQRARIVVDIGRAIRDRCGRDFVMGVKVSFDEMVGPRGITPDKASETVRLLHATGLFDYVSVSGGGYHAIEKMVTPIEAGSSGHSAGEAALAKQIVGDLPVVVTGTIRDLHRAAEIVAAGQADVVGMVRAHIADPNIVRKGQSGRLLEIRPCMGANQGCWRRVMHGQILTCTVNPSTGRSDLREDDQGGASAADAGSAALRVAVVGAGPGGLAAAEAAARSGHAVTLLEREGELGGQLRWAGRLPGRATWLSLIEYFEGSLDRLGVTVRTATDVTADVVAALEVDVVVVATGSRWDTSGLSIRRPDQDGIITHGDTHVLTPPDVVKDPAQCGQRVVIVDGNGDYLPLGLAELLSGLGRRVEIVSAHAQAGGNTSVASTVDLPVIYPRLVAAGVVFTNEASVDEIRPGVAEIRDAWGRWQRATLADTVILSMGRYPEDHLYDELRSAGIRTLRAGDCLAPREVDDAIFEGNLAGEQLGVAFAP